MFSDHYCCRSLCVFVHFWISQCLTCLSGSRLFHLSTLLEMQLYYYQRYLFVMAKSKQLSDALQTPSGCYITWQPGVLKAVEKNTLVRWDNRHVNCYLITQNWLRLCLNSDSWFGDSTVTLNHAWQMASCSVARFVSLILIWKIEYEGCIRFHWHVITQLELCITRPSKYITCKKEFRDSDVLQSLVLALLVLATLRISLKNSWVLCIFFPYFLHVTST